MIRTILGIDPGFASLGWATCAIEEPGFRTRQAWLSDCGVIRTKKDTRKVLQTEDNARRLRILWNSLDSALEGLHIVAICTESQSWPRNASSAIKVGMAWGVVVAYAEAHRLPLVQASPQEIKLACTGSASASKAEVLAGVSSRNGFRQLPDLLKHIKAKGQHEHPTDACGAIIACLDSDVIRAVMG